MNLREPHLQITVGAPSEDICQGKGIADIVPLGPQLQDYSSARIGLVEGDQPPRAMPEYNPVHDWDEGVQAYLEAVFGAERFAAMAAALLRPSLATCLRVNSLRTTVEVLMFNIKLTAFAMPVVARCPLWGCAMPAIRIAAHFMSSVNRVKCASTLYGAMEP